MTARCFILVFALLATVSTASGKNYTDEEAMAAWVKLKAQPVTEASFREACDLMQDIAQTNIKLSYYIFTEYLPVIYARHNNRWIHVLLMGWARAKESLHLFADADSLYHVALQNTRPSTRAFNEVMVGLVLTYADWDRPDSLAKYATLGEASCKSIDDRENLSLLLSFRSFAFINDTATHRRMLDSAIALATGLPDKNALFTAKYDYALFVCQSAPQQQVQILESLMELARDSSLNHRPRLYERTGFFFRGPALSVYYQLMQVNLLLTDYGNAGKFAELFYQTAIAPNPASPTSPHFYAELALIKTYQGDYAAAQADFDKSKSLFNLPEKDIPSSSYYLIAGRLAEHRKDYATALHYYEIASKKGSSFGLHVVQPGIYYAHALILTGQLARAEQQLQQFVPSLSALRYSAVGYYYYANAAELLKAKGDYNGYAHALDTFYQIKDSLNNLNHYRIIQDVETKMRVREKESQISQLNEENQVRQEKIRRQRINGLIFSALAIVIIALLLAFIRNLYRRRQQAEQIARQNEALQQNKIIEMEKQHRIDVMQGAIDAEENERRKIADQLHDEVGGMLALASLNISSVVEKGVGDTQSPDKIAKAGSILAQAGSSIRDISHRLTPLFIEKYSFRKAIEDLAAAVNLSGKLRLDTVIVGFDDDKKYPVSLLNNLYRVAQELVHNIIKHAQASEALLELVEHDRQISMMVEDNGRGIDPARASQGKGLDSIRSKIAYLNGKLEIMNKNEGGTLVVIELET